MLFSGIQPALSFSGIIKSLSGTGISSGKRTDPYMDGKRTSGACRCFLFGTNSGMVYAVSGTGSFFVYFFSYVFDRSAHYDKGSENGAETADVPGDIGYFICDVPFGLRAV